MVVVVGAAVVVPAVQEVAVHVVEKAEVGVGAATEVAELVAVVALVAAMVVAVGVEARSWAPPVGRLVVAAMAEASLAMVATVVVAAWEEVALVG